MQALLRRVMLSRHARVVRAPTSSSLPLLPQRIPPRLAGSMAYNFDKEYDSSTKPDPEDITEQVDEELKEEYGIEPETTDDKTSTGAPKEHFGHGEAAQSAAGKKGAALSNELRPPEARKEAARKAARTRAEKYGHHLYKSDPENDDLLGTPTTVKDQAKQ